MNQALGRFDRLVTRQSAPDEMDFLHLMRRQQEFLPAGSAFEDIHRRVYILLCDPPVENQFHVAGTLELLKNQFIRPAVGLDQRRRHNRERPSLTRVARRRKESPRTLERWRWSGKGPAFVKLGGRVVYRLEVIETFEAEGNRTITGRFQ